MSGSPTNPSRGLAAVMRPMPVAAADAVVLLDQIEPSEEPVAEPLADHGSVEHVLRRVADRRLACRLVEPRHEVAVDVGVNDRYAERGATLARRPDPLNSAPSTARSRSASGMTTSGFLPPSSRHGDWR